MAVGYGHASLLFEPHLLQYIKLIFFAVSIKVLPNCPWLCISRYLSSRHLPSFWFSRTISQNCLHTSPCLLKTLSWMVFKAWCCSCEAGAAVKFSLVQSYECMFVVPQNPSLHFSGLCEDLSLWEGEDWVLAVRRRKDSSAAPGSWWGEKKEKLNRGRINWGELSIINLKDNGKAPLPQNKNSEANKIYASPYYNLCRCLTLFSPSPASSVIVFLYVRCPEMCLHLCLESI